MSPHEQPNDKLLQVFLSYSRKDLPAAEALRDRLNAAGFGAYLDKHDIMPGEPWQERLALLIEKADTVVFLISPHSAKSEICDWELNEAERLAKRILPVVVRDAPANDVPGRLRRLNYIFLRGPEEEATGLADLSQALTTDIAWVRDHTRLGELAAEWDRSARMPERLLRGSALIAAELWISRRHGGEQEPTALHRSFITASREGEQVRAEAEQTQIARTRRFQRTSAWALSVVAVLVAAGMMAAALQARNAALLQARVLTVQAQKAIDVGHFDRALRIALYGLPPRGSLPFVAPWSADLEAKLAGAAYASRQICKMPGARDINASVSASPDGAKLAIGNDDGSTSVWDARRCKHLFVARAAGQYVMPVRFSSDGRHITMRLHDKTSTGGSSDQSWDVEAGRAMPVEAARANRPDHKTYRTQVELATIADSDKYLLVRPFIDANSKQRDKRILVVKKDASRLDQPIETRPDGTFSFHPTIAVVATLDASEFIGVRLSDDGSEIIAIDRYGIIKRFDVPTGSLKNTVNAGDGNFQVVHFSQKGNRALLFGPQGPDARSAARIVDLTSGMGADLPQRFEPNEPSFSPDGMKLIVYNHGNSTISVWDTSTGRAFLELKSHEATISWAEFSKTSDMLFTASQDGTVRVWDTTAPAKVTPLEGLPDRPMRQISLRRDATKALIILQAEEASESNNVKPWIWNANGDGRVVPLSEAPGNGWAEGPPHDSNHSRYLPVLLPEAVEDWEIDAVRLLDFPIKGRQIVGAWSGGQKRRIATTAEDLNDQHVYIREGIDGPDKVILTGHLQAPGVALFSPDGQLILTYKSVDYSTRLWDAKSGKQIEVVIDGSRTTTDAVMDAKFTADGRYLLLATSDLRRRVWSISPLKQIMSLPLSGAAEMEVSPKSDRVLLGDEGQLAIVDLGTGQQILRLDVRDAQSQRAIFNADGSGVFSIWSDRNVRTYDFGWPLDLTGEALRDRVCAEKLKGAQVVTEADADDPILAGRHKINVCELYGPLSWRYWSDLIRSLRS